MSKLPLKNSQGEALGEVDLADELLVFDKGLQAVHDAVVAHRAAARAGTASTRTRADVQGGGRKPYKQKGTGRARAGSIRSPIWRGGGTVFGPHPRSYAKPLPRKMARLAFRRAVSEKVAAGQVVVLDAIELPEAKTRHVAALVERLPATGHVLFVVDRVDEGLRRAARNLPRVTVRRADQVSTYEVLRAGLVAATRPGLAGIETRLRGATAKGA